MVFLHVATAAFIGKIVFYDRNMSRFISFFYPGDIYWCRQDLWYNHYRVLVRRCLSSVVSTMKLKKTLTLGNFHILFWNLAYLIFMAFFKDCMKKIHDFSIFYTPSIWKKDLENFQWFFTMKFQTTLTMGNFVLLFSNLAYLIFRTCLKDCAKKIHDFSIFYTPSILDTFFSGNTELTYHRKTALDLSWRGKSNDNSFDHFFEILGPSRGRQSATCVISRIFAIFKGIFLHLD